MPLAKFESDVWTEAIRSGSPATGTELLLTNAAMMLAVSSHEFGGVVVFVSHIFVPIEALLNRPTSCTQQHARCPAHHH
ncbi:hypothetical protein [Mesorhizobium sp. L2C066B000]|uniref:hypothetical protein n=1 Tax=Mesorhizobium sp. L2C066B000 TaxID=1287105 RepID=UPI001FDA3CB8|nr:hypothetical protein [Mesorhizobium sp. L2C066B000]